MPTLINISQGILDEWIRVADDKPDLSQERIILGGDALKRLWPDLANSSRALGVELQADDRIDEFQAYLPRLGIILLNFPVFTDGRAFSQARLLRQAYAYRGEIRAVGQVLRDQLSFMQRCGFSQFLLADGEQVDQALSSFAEIGGSYQPQAKISLAS